VPDDAARFRAVFEFLDQDGPRREFLPYERLHSSTTLAKPLDENPKFPSDSHFDQFARPQAYRNSSSRSFGGFFPWKILNSFSR